MLRFALLCFALLWFMELQLPCVGRHLARTPRCPPFLVFWHIRSCQKVGTVLHPWKVACGVSILPPLSHVGNCIQLRRYPQKPMLLCVVRDPGRQLDSTPDWECAQEGTCASEASSPLQLDWQDICAPEVTPVFGCPQSWLVFGCPRSLLLM